MAGGDDSSLFVRYRLECRPLVICVRGRASGASGASGTMAVLRVASPPLFSSFSADPQVLRRVRVPLSGKLCRDHDVLSASPSWKFS